MVAELVVAQDELQKVLDAKPDDEAALRQALKKATDAGLQKSTRGLRVVQAAQEYLHKARTSGFYRNTIDRGGVAVQRYVELYAHSTMHPLDFWRGCLVCT